MTLAAGRRDECVELLHYLLVLSTLNLRRAPYSSSALAMLHGAVILYGLTAILGRLLDISGYAIVWYRLVLSLLCLAMIFPRVLRGRLALPRFKVWSTGILITCHWVCFYEAVKYSNASIAVCGVSSAAVFVAVLEPVLGRKRFELLDVGLSVLVMGAFALMVEGLRPEQVTGLVIAIVSGLLIALYSIYTKRFVATVAPGKLMFEQFVAGALFLSVLAPVFYLVPQSGNSLPIQGDWLWLGVLVVFCTIGPFILQLRALQQLSAFTVSLAINLEPVYGVIFAAVMLNESAELSSRFYVGAGIIAVSILFHGWLAHNRARGRALAPG